MNSAEFLAIERPVLDRRNMLNIGELELFKAVDCWAGKECERQNLEAEGPVKREINGEQIVKNLRFPVIKREEFMTVVLDSGILTKEELCDVVNYWFDVCCA